jgi:hypothetical protein
MDSKQPIREFLTGIAQRDADGRYVYPKSDVEKRLAEEIHDKTGCQIAGDALVNHHGELFPKQPVSADADKFVDSTLAALEEQVAALKKVSPKEFEVGFKNFGKTDAANSWGDQITFRVRFTTAASAA